ncbi:MAG TPA: hypothetical protein VF772_02310, partial [Terriglobales bacterium]
RRRRRLNNDCCQTKHAMERLAWLILSPFRSPATVFSDLVQTNVVPERAAAIEATCYLIDDTGPGLVSKLPSSDFDLDF